MKLNWVSKLLLSICLCGSLVTNSFACTVLAIEDAQGNVYQGRTNEFAGQQPDSLMYFPAGTQMESLTPTGKAGLAFTTKYGVLGVFLAGPFDPAAKNPSVHEAVNDQGMTFTTNALIENDPPIPTGPAEKILSALDVGMWALGNFSTVEQVKQAIKNKDVEIWLPRIASMDNFIAPLHFALYDKQGGAIVIEFTNGKTEVYDNPVRVMTNDPPFPWHLTNMNNYAYLTNIDKNVGQFNKLKVTATDSGSAQAGLPSIETSVGRFVKAAYYSNFVTKAKTPDQALITLGHVMNNFDRPKGISSDLPGTASKAEATASGKVSSENTYFTVMNDLSRGHFYIRTINGINYAKFDITQLKDLKKLTVVRFSEVNALGRLDATELFLK
jgi:choloylglycine hydrolase